MKRKYVPLVVIEIEKDKNMNSDILLKGETIKKKKKKENDNTLSPRSDLFLNDESLPKRKNIISINDALMSHARNKKKVVQHSWLNIHTWGEATNKGNYTRKIGDRRVTIYKNRVQDWQYVLDGEHSTAYVSLEGVLNATFSALREDILKYIPI